MEPDLPGEYHHLTILVAPIDWGMGHATRCVPIIRALSKNNTLLLGASTHNFEYLNTHFPDLVKIELPTYGIQYSKLIPAYLKVLLQAMRIFSVIRKENRILRSLYDKHKLDLVISDNRFGLFHPKIHSVIMSHQLELGFFNSLAALINHKLLGRFNEIWVPDFKDPGRRLSGMLSNANGISIPVHYIGPLTALEDPQQEIIRHQETDLLILLSGPEPQRSLLEKKLLKKQSTFPKKTVMIRGTNVRTNNGPAPIEVIDFAFGKELSDQILAAKKIVCRSGYSTLMDLYFLNKKNLILIPTPGQPEQKYLATYWSDKFGARVVHQKDLDRLEL